MDTSSARELMAMAEERLQKNGVLDALDGQIRAALYECLSMSQKPENLSILRNQETLIINELIRDYLKWNGYEGSLSVFSAGIFWVYFWKFSSIESNAPSEMMDKSSLTEVLNISTKDYPHNMYIILFH